MTSLTIPDPQSSDMRHIYGIRYYNVNAPSGISSPNSITKPSLDGYLY